MGGGKPFFPHTQLALTFYKVARAASLVFLFMLSIDPNGVLASALKFITLLVAGHGSSQLADVDERMDPTTTTVAKMCAPSLCYKKHLKKEPNL